MKRLIAGSAIVGSLVGIATTVAAPGHADTSADFGEENYIAICNLVGQEPTPHGIWAANSYLLTAQSSNLNYGQMQSAIGYAIGNHCAQYTAIYGAYRSRYP